MQTRKKILYIEDNQANLRLMDAFFKLLSGYDLLIAQSGSLGLEISKTESIDVFLVDVGLPDMNGFEVLSAIRGNPDYTKAPIFAISANAIPNDVERGLNAGFNEYITKPLDLDHLRNCIENYI